MYISHTCAHLPFLHPPAVASVAGRQLGDIEAGTWDTAARNKKHRYNRLLATVFRREKEQRERQTDARNADGIMGGKDGDRI